MGNSPSPSRRAVPVQRDEEISEDKIPPPSDTETEYYINDKVKIIPSVSLTTQPNPVSTLEQQSKMARSKLQKNHRLKLGNNVTSTEEELKEIDQHAARVPLSALNSFKELIDYFNEPLQGNSDQEQLLIRSFLVWLAHQQDTLENVDIDDSQQSITSFRSTEGHGRTPDALVKLLRNNKTTYTTCFVLLCWAAGIRCVKIDGVCRTGKSTELKQCVWTAVLVDDAWQIVHPYRVCQGLSGKLQKEFYKPSDNNTTTNDVTKGSFLNHYIFCNPHYFIYECYPNDSKWQLLPEPITIERFQTLEFLYHPWWEMGLKLTSKQSRELVAENGRITISFEGIDNSAKELVLWYDLQLLQSDISSGEDNPSNDYLQRLVYLVRNKIVWNCDIILPVTGKYKIIFYGGQFNRPLLRICEFDITCDFCHPDPIPLPRNPNVIGLGPGPVIKSVGISYPSHESGLIHSSIDKPLKLKFRVDKTITRNCITKAKLITSELTAKHEEGENITFNSVCIVQEKRTYKEIMITVTPPTSPGLYLLEIFTEKTTVDPPEVAIACYYLINFEAVEDMTLSDESYSIKVARKMLKHAMKIDNIPEILFRIQDLTSQKISELDKDVQTARARIVMLKKKQPIRDMNIDQRLQSLNVVRQTEYELRLYDLTNKLEKLESRMREKDQFNETESQTANDMSDGINMSLSLVRTLLGRSVDTKKKDNDIAEMLHQLKHQGLVLQPNDVKQVSSLLDQLTFNQMQSYNSSIANAIYKSVQDIVCLMTG